MPILRIRLLGGFQVERAHAPGPVTNWQRRSAKTLIKVLACHDGHTLHREQLLELLWPGHDLERGLNGLGKALHAARRAIEPDLMPRQASAYLQMTDAMLALKTKRVTVDADRFEALAQAALRRQDLNGYDSALAAYGGELLPEDRYEEWCVERRDYLSALRMQLLLRTATLLEDQGALAESADRLRTVVGEDPAREDAQRRLMLLYAKMGLPDQAVRQFHLCVAALRRELDLAPQAETVALYESVLASRSATDAGGRRDREAPVAVSTVALPEVRTDMPFLGREPIMRSLLSRLKDAGDGGPGLIVLHGEAGVGVTRLLREFASAAAARGAAVLWGGSGAHARRFDCGPFVVAVEGYVASRSETERGELLARYPDLAGVIPSAGTTETAGIARMQTEGESYARDADQAAAAAVVRLLSDLSRGRPVLLVLGDLHEADPFSLGLVRYLSHLAITRPLLIVGAVREENLEPGDELYRLIESTTRERLCQTIAVPCLSRWACDRLVASMLRRPASKPLLERIYASSCGNPLFIEELVGELQAAEPERVPPRVRARTAARLASMDGAARRVIELAVAAGTDEISLTRLRTAAAALDPPVSGSALYDALDCALRQRVLEERRTGYGFRHPLVRCALNESFSRHRREQARIALGTVQAAAGSEVVRKQAGTSAAHAPVRWHA